MAHMPCVATIDKATNIIRRSSFDTFSFWSNFDIYVSFFLRPIWKDRIVSFTPRLKISYNVGKDLWLVITDGRNSNEMWNPLLTMPPNFLGTFSLSHSVQISFKFDYRSLTKLPKKCKKVICMYICIYVLWYVLCKETFKGPCIM